MAMNMMDEPRVSEGNMQREQSGYNHHLSNDI